jgi:Fe-S cluster biogenesis protein NfuA
MHMVLVAVIDSSVVGGNACPACVVINYYTLQQVEYMLKHYIGQVSKVVALHYNYIVTDQRTAQIKLKQQGRG